MADVFISYVKENGPLAAQIAEALASSQISAWYFERDGDRPGTSYAQAIVEAISASRVMLVIVSSASLESHQVCREIEFAHNHKKRFLPVLVDVSLATMQKRRPEWDLMFGTAVAIQLSANIGDDCKRIAQGAHALLETRHSEVTVGKSQFPDWDKFQAQIICRHEFGLAWADFSPDGRRVVTASGWGGTVHVWDAHTGSELMVLRGHVREDELTAAAYSPDGSKIVTSSWDGTVRLWNSVNGNELLKFRAVDEIHRDLMRFAAFSPDSRYVVAISDLRGIFVFDASTGEIIKKFKPERYCHRAKFSPDGTRLIATEDDVGRIWDVASGQPLLRLNGHASSIDDISYSPDGSLVATASSSDNSLRIWDSGSGGVVLAVHDLKLGGFKSVDFSPDGQHIVTGCRGGNVAVWNVTTLKQVGNFRGHYHEDADDRKNWPPMVYSAKFSPDGKRIVSSSMDRTARIWGDPTKADSDRPSPSPKSDSFVSRIFKVASPPKDLRYD